MGGRGSGGAGGGGARGGGGGGNRLGSSSNPVTAGQLDRMTETERKSALNAMPVGTSVSIAATPGSSPTQYVKTSSGWEAVTTTKTVRGGRLVNTKTTYKVPSGSAGLARYANSTRTRQVKYPKK